jgi:hypothetical protein
MRTTKYGSAPLKTESTFLQSLKVKEVYALSNSWRGGRDVALLSEMERVRATQLVGANPGVEAWRSERLLQKFRETTTLTAS